MVCDTNRVCDMRMTDTVATLVQNYTVYDWVEFGLNLPALARKLRQRRFKVSG